MHTALIIIGLVLVGIGLIVFLVPPKEPAAPQGVVGDLAKVLEQLNALLEKFDKRYRPGLILMLVGLALIGAGIYGETVDAKNAAKKPAAPAALVITATSTG